MLIFILLIKISVWECALYYGYLPLMENKNKIDCINQQNDTIKINK